MRRPSASPHWCRRTGCWSAESGLNTTSDLERLSRSGVNTFLIGESLMRQEDVEAATRSILTGETAETMA